MHPDSNSIAGGDKDDNNNNNQANSNIPNRFGGDEDEEDRFIFDVEYRTQAPPQRRPVQTQPRKATIAKQIICYIMGSNRDSNHVACTRPNAATSLIRSFVSNHLFCINFHSLFLSHPHKQLASRPRHGDHPHRWFVIRTTWKTRMRKSIAFSGTIVRRQTIDLRHRLIMCGLSSSPGPLQRDALHRR